MWRSEGSGSGNGGSWLVRHGDEEGLATLSASGRILSFLTTDRMDSPGAAKPHPIHGKCQRHFDHGFHRWARMKSKTKEKNRNADAEIPENAQRFSLPGYPTQARMDTQANARLGKSVVKKRHQKASPSAKILTDSSTDDGTRRSASFPSSRPQTNGCVSLRAKRSHLNPQSRVLRSIQIASLRSQ